MFDGFGIVSLTCAVVSIYPDVLGGSVSQHVTFKYNVRTNVNYPTSSQDPNWEVFGFGYTYIYIQYIYIVYIHTWIKPSAQVPKSNDEPTIAGVFATAMDVTSDLELE